MDTQRNSNLLLFSDRERPTSGQPRSTSLSVADELIGKKEKKRAYNVAYYAANREKLRAQKAAYYATNREKIRAQQAAYAASHKEERAAYRAANPEQIRASNAAYSAGHRDEIRSYQRAYCAANPEKDRARSAAYRAANPEKNRARCAAYRAANPEKVRDSQAACYAAHPERTKARTSIRRAKIHKSTIGDRAAISEIYRKAKEDPKVRCYICNKLIPMGDRHVDHIFPVAKDGPTRPSNLGITHSKCNLHKGAKHPNELGILV